VKMILKPRKPIGFVAMVPAVYEKIAAAIF
jgi:hypothetical protein